MKKMEMQINASFFILKIIKKLLQIYLTSKVNNGIKHFADYDIIKDENSKIEKYPDEECLQVPLKEAVYILCECLYPDVAKELITLFVNLWVKDVTPYRLSKLLGVSKQMVSQMTTQQIQIPKNRHEDMAKVLEFDVKEFERGKNGFVFDESDL